MREITRVATKETEAEWIALAEEKGIRQIERAVSRVNHGERPPKDPYSLSKARIKVVGELLMADYAVWETAFDRLRERCGHDLDASSALVLLARSFLEQPLEGQEKESRKAFQVVYHRCSECANAWIRTSDGVEGVQQSLVENREIHAEVHVLDEEDFSSNSNPNDPRGALSPCDPGGSSSPSTPVVPKEERDIPNTPRIRRHVLNRDGHVCAGPGCGNKGYLSAHHVIWRTHGGDTEPVNEISVCTTCHGLIHEGLLQVTGISPEGLEWFDGKGRPLDQRMSTPGNGKKRYSKDHKGSDPRWVVDHQGVVDEHGAEDQQEDTTLTSLDQIPDKIDSAWWRKHSHNLVCRGNRSS